MNKKLNVQYLFWMAFNLGAPMWVGLNVGSKKRERERESEELIDEVIRIGDRGRQS